MNTITVKDTSGNDVEIAEEELNRNSCFVLGSNMTALVAIETEKDGSHFMETRLIVPKPENNDDPVPVSSLFLTSIAVQTKDTRFIQQNIDWLRVNIDHLKEEKEDK